MSAINNQYPFESATDSVMTRTIEGIINFWNHAAEDLYGWKKEEAIGRVSHDLLQTKFPKPLEEIESELVTRGQWEGKLVHSTRDGASVVVESRWTLDLNEDRQAVVEINMRSPDSEMNPNPRTASYLPKIQRQQPLRAEDLLVKIANIVIVGGGVACLFFLFYIIYYYAWTGERSFTSQVGMILYYGFPASLAALLFTSLRLSPSFRGNLALVLVSTCIALYSLELILVFSQPVTFGNDRTLWFPPSTKRDLREIVDVAKQYGVNFDTRSKLQIIAELRGRNISAVPAIVPQGLLKMDGSGALKSQVTIKGTNLLPLAGVSSRVTVLCNETGEYVIYNSDQYGFHNPKAIWNEGRFDIAAVGDSFTHGYCVPSDKNFVGLLRQHYPATLNLGVSGNGPLSTLATIKEYLRFAKPRVVLWFFWEGNDLIDLKKERNSPLLMRYLEDNFSQGLVHLQPDIDAALTAYIETAGRNVERHPEEEDEAVTAAERIRVIGAIIKLSNLRGRLGWSYGADGYGTANETAVTGDDIKLFQEVLSQAKMTISEWGGTAYFIYLPERDRYVHSRIANLDDKTRKEVMRIARSAGFSVIDINDVFQSQADPLNLFPFRRLLHYNEQGHRVVAEAVLESIAPTN
jgi:PAS domain S-box-containing protein